MAPVCPICSTDNSDDSLDCSRCHLSTALFEPVRAAIELPPGDPQYLVKAREVAAAVGGPGLESEAVGPAMLSQAARFPAMRGPAAESPVPIAPSRRTVLASLPALPAASDVPALRRRLEEYVQLGRRLGVELTAFTDRIHVAVETADRSQLERLDRELFVHFAAALSDEYEEAVERRDEWAALIDTHLVDLELVACRSSLGVGDLSGTAERLEELDRLLDDLEEEWSTVQILVAEVELLADTVRELGSDPGPVLGPLEEGKRLARVGQREEAEPILAHATKGVWTLLAPKFTTDLDRLRDLLLLAREQGADIGPPTADLRILATDLGRRNYAAAVAAYRRVRDWTERNPAVAGPTAPTVVGPISPSE